MAKGGKKLPRRANGKGKQLPWLTMLAVPVAAYLAYAHGAAVLLQARKLTYSAASPTADHLGFGDVLLAAGDEDGARAAYVAAARFAPDSAPSLGAAAASLAAQADALSSSALSSDASHVHEEVRAAVEAARSAVEAALDADEANPRARAALPVLMRAIAGTTAEIEDLRRQLGSGGAEPAVPTLNKLQIALKKVRGGYGRFAEAVDALYTAVRLVPRFDIGWFNLGFVPPRASPPLRLRPAPTDPPHHSCACAACRQTLSSVNRFEEEASAFRHVVRLAPEDWEAFEKLGDACREHGSERGAICGDGAAARAMTTAQKGGRPQVYLGRMLYRHGLALRRDVAVEAAAVSVSEPAPDTTDLTARWERSTEALRRAVADYEARAPAEAGPFTLARVLTALGDAPSLERAHALYSKWCDSARIRGAAPLPPAHAPAADTTTTTLTGLAPRLAELHLGSEARFANFTCAALLAEVEGEQRAVAALARGGRPSYKHAFDSDRLYRERFNSQRELKARVVDAVMGGARDGAAAAAAEPSAAQAREIARRYSAAAYAHIATTLSAEEKASGELAPATAERAYLQFEENGLVAFEGALPAAEVAAMRAFVNDEAFHAPGFPVASGIKNPALRFYPLLTLAQAQPLLGRITRLLRPLFDAVVGADAALCELGVIVADPGSAGQCAHVDTAPRWDDFATGGGEQQPGALISVFVALGDVSFDQGAFEAWPGSHRNYFNVDATFTAHHEEDGVRFAAPAGTIYAYTSSLVHRGRGNDFHKRRANFMFSVVRRHTSGARQHYTMPRGSTWALLKEYGTRDAGFTKSAGDLEK